MDSLNSVIDSLEELLLSDTTTTVVKNEATIDIKNNKEVAKFVCPDVQDNENLLNETTRKQTIEEINIIGPTRCLTLISGTTATVAGFVEGISFQCEPLMPHLRATERIRVIHSNFLTIYFDPNEAIVSAPQPKKKKKSTRAGRERKMQGTGRDFNSQVTFEITSRLHRDRKKPEKWQVYKFKVFHTGMIQLPGGLPYMLDEIIESVNLIADTMRDAIQRMTNVIVPQPTNIKYINYVLKNYKFAIKMREDQMLRLNILAELLREHQALKIAPKIDIISYTREETKLTIKFATPVDRDAKKQLTMKIFRRGKVNILGGLRIDYTKSIYELIDNVLKQYWGRIVCTEGMKL